MKIYLHKINIVWTSEMFTCARAKGMWAEQRPTELTHDRLFYYTIFYSYGGCMDFCKIIAPFGAAKLSTGHFCQCVNNRLRLRLGALRQPTKAYANSQILVYRMHEIRKVGPNARCTPATNWSEFGISVER